VHGRKGPVFAWQAHGVVCMLCIVDKPVNLSRGPKEWYHWLAEAPVLSTVGRKE